MIDIKSFISCEPEPPPQYALHISLDQYLLPHRDTNLERVAFATQHATRQLAAGGSGRRLLRRAGCLLRKLFGGRKILERAPAHGEHLLGFRAWACLAGADAVYDRLAAVPD